MRRQTMSQASPGTVPLTLFADYNCPFCYVASHRLKELGRRHDLDILWRFLELHPDIPAGGRALNHEETATHRDDTLLGMIRNDGLPWQPRALSVNTRRALLLAQAVQLYRREAFLSLHLGLFHAVFGEGRNVGDPDVVRAVAQAHGVEDLVEVAWGTPKPVELFLSHVEAAQELEITSIPALVVSGRVFPGAASMEILEQALRHAAERPG